MDIRNLPRLRDLFRFRKLGSWQSIMRFLVRRFLKHCIDLLREQLKDEGQKPHVLEQIQRTIGALRHVIRSLDNRRDDMAAMALHRTGTDLWKALRTGRMEG